jgi:hypothetical protein
MKALIALALLFAAAYLTFRLLRWSLRNQLDNPAALADVDLICDSEGSQP